MNIGLPHGVRQPQAGNSGALLGLDSVEHLVSGRRYCSRVGIGVVFDIDGACTCSGASSVRAFCPIMGCSAGSLLYDTSRRLPGPGRVTNSSGSRIKAASAQSCQYFLVGGRKRPGATQRGLACSKVPCLIPAAAAICPSSLHVVGGAAGDALLLQEDSATAGRKAALWRY